MQPSSNSTGDSATDASQPVLRPVLRPVLQIDGLTKRYRRRTAVSELSLTVYPGDIYGFLGPNGAGKTTTMRMIVGLIRPSAGSVTIAGERLTFWHRAPLARLGAIVEAPAFYTFLSGRDNLRMLASLSGPCPARRIDEVLDRVELLGRADDKVAVYSHGMKQRLAIAAALLPRPSLVLLDEPTNGLDPMGIRDVRDLIRSLARDDGLTIFLSSHLLVEVQQICNRGAVLAQGRKLWEGEISQLLGTGQRIRLRATPVERAHPVIAELGAAVAGHAGPDTGAAGTGSAGQVMHVAGAIAPDELVARLVQAGCRVHEITTETPSLEEVFLALVARQGANPGKEPA